MKRGFQSIVWTGLVVLAATAAVLFLGLPREESRVDLSDEEIEWLQTHAGSLRFAPLPDSPPIDFIDANGLHRGVTADYLRLIEKQLGIRFQLVRCENWKEILTKLRAQEIDLVGSVQNTPERQSFLRFTEPYMRISNFILARTDSDETFSLDALGGMSIAIVDDSATCEHVRQLHPEYEIIPVPDAATGFRMVSFMQADVMIADAGVASFYIMELGLSNLRVAGRIDYPWDLCFASRKDWPLLNSILDKALANITGEQRRAIRREWITLSDTHLIPRERYLRIIGGILLATVLAIGAVMFWNRTLRRQVTHRTYELGRVRQSHAQATRALGESEERFRNLVESSNDIIWEMDQFGCYTYVSPRVRDILGFDPGQLIGQSSFSLMPPPEAAKAMERLRACKVGAAIANTIGTYLHKDGRKVVMESSSVAFADNTGTLAGFRGVSRDITGRIAAEHALRRSEERFRNLVETTSDWIWEVDTQGRYTYASPQVADLLGHPPADLLGKPFTCHMPPAEAEAVAVFFKEVVEQGAPIQSLVNINRHKDGRTVVVETSAVPFYDKEWTIQGYRGIGRDITDRVAAEKRLEFERNLFRSFMEHAPDLIYFKNREGRFIEVNSAMAESVNLHPDELVGRSDFDLLPPEQARRKHEDEQEVMRTERAMQKEERWTTPEGDRWYFTTKVPRYDEAGTVVGTFGTSWDITHRKLAEEQLRQLRAMLSNTIDSMPSILVGVDRAGRVTQWNRKAEAASGLQASGAIGRALGDAFPALAREMAKVERAILHRSAQREERIPVQEDGRIRYNDVTVYPLLEGDAEGAVIRVDDVTDRVLIEDSIRNIVEGVAAVGRRFFQSMVTQLAKTLDADFTFISEFCDDEHQAMRTIAVSDKAGQGANFEFGLAQTPCEMVLKGGGCLYVTDVRTRYPETQLLQSLGIESYIGIPLADSENKPLGIMVAMYRQPVEQVDFAKAIMQVFAGRTAAELERLQATKELVALRNLLENIIDSMPSILVGIDAAGCVVQWNREAVRITGIDAARAKGLPLSRVFADLGPRLAQALETLGASRLQQHERIQYAIKGEPHVVDVTVYPITTDGSEGAVLRLDDVTDRVRIEEMMVQSEKMMSVGGLAAGMAHEINNPLAGILQNLQVMRNRIMDPTPLNTSAAHQSGTTLEAVQAFMQLRGLVKMMDSMADSGRRAAKIVDNMLSFSRKDEAYFAPNDLVEIIERSVELASNDYNLKKRFDFRHIRIVRELDASLGLVPCEGSQIQQVLLNLLSNSAQAMADRLPDAPEPVITLRLRRDGDMALVEVEDNGPGMNEETRKRVFEPFFTTKEVGHGTGLGLSVSYFIITENHGGSMSLYSVPGKGARFSFRIPFEHRFRQMGLRL